MKVRPERWFIVTLIILLTLVMVACTRPARPGSDEATATADAVASGTVTDTAPVDSTGGVTTTVPAESISPTASPVPVDNTGVVTSTAPTATPESAAATPPQPTAMSTPVTGAITNTTPVTSTGATTVAPTATPTTGAIAPTATPTAGAGQTTAPTVGTPPATEITHTVKAGENLYQIGLLYGYSWVVLAQYNNIPNPNYVVVGTVLKIPGSSTPTATPTAPTEVLYTVRAGDTLGSIAAAYGISWVQIAEANGLVNPNLIYPGQILKIPSNTPGPTPQFTHTVRQGETLFLISLHYGVHWTDIAEANHISAPYVIFPGQTLIILGGN